MKIDLAKLRDHATRAKAARLDNGDARAKRGNGSFAAIRAALPMIEELLATGGYEWPDVVTALTEQGVRTRKGEPLTVPRLTSLIASVRKQEAAKRLRSDARRARADVANALGIDPATQDDVRPAGPAQKVWTAGARTKLALSKELAPVRPEVDGGPPAASEERDRKAAHSRMGRFVKGQK